MNNDSNATTTSIKASSRVSVKIGDNYYTVEYTEERSLSDNANVDTEKSLLWNDVNSTVDNQVEDIFKTFS